MLNNGVSAVLLYVHDEKIQICDIEALLATVRTGLKDEESKTEMKIRESKAAVKLALNWKGTSAEINAAVRKSHRYSMRGEAGKIPEEEAIGGII